MTKTNLKMSQMQDKVIAINHAISQYNEVDLDEKYKGVPETDIKFVDS